MSQDSKWGALYLIIGAVLAGLLGVFQNWWTGRANTREDFLNMIDQNRLMLESDQFDASLTYRVKSSDMNLYITKLKRVLFKRNRIKLEKAWKEYQEMEKSLATITKHEIKHFWDFCYDLASSNWT